MTMPSTHPVGKTLARCAPQPQGFPKSTRENEMNTRLRRKCQTMVGAITPHGSRRRIDAWHVAAAHPARYILMGLFGLLLFLPLLATAASTLHLTSAAHNIDGRHAYQFSGHYDYSGGKVAERVGIHVHGWYTPASGIAEEQIDIQGGQPGLHELVKTLWSCPKDPWLDQTVRCTEARPGRYPQLSGSQYYIVYLCANLGLIKTSSGLCFVSRKLVPAAVAVLMRNGPPPPAVAGAAKVSGDDSASLTVKYPRGVAEQYWIQHWVCPPGKDGHPGDLPGDVMPFGGACQSSVMGPLKLPPGSTSTQIRLAYPASVPTAGTWYVRARLESQSYGKGAWGHWHRTVVGPAPMHVQDAPNVAPKILTPNPNQMFVNQNVQIRIAAGRARPDAARWEYVLEWQRADYHTKGDNIVWKQNQTAQPGTILFPRVEGIATPMRPWAAPPALQALPETQGVSSANIAYTSLRSPQPDSSFQYRFRVRERIRDSKAYGPWSDWRAFVVSRNGAGAPHGVVPLKLPMRPLPGHKPDTKKGPLNLPPRTSGGH